MERKKQNCFPAQTSFLEEIIVDNFAGGGGASGRKASLFGTTAKNRFTTIICSIRSCE